MRGRGRAWLAVGVVAVLFATAFQRPAAGEDPSTPLGAGKVLFDFEDAADLAKWSPLTLENRKLPGADEPAAKLELSTEGVTLGKHSLKITFDGGRWPTVTTEAVPVAENWVEAKFATLKADVTVTRVCLVGFRVLLENRLRNNPWVKTELLLPGKNEITGTLGGWWLGMEAKDGKVTTVEIFLYKPHKGESICVDNLRLSTEKAPAGDARPVKFQVLGTDLGVTSVQDLGNKLKDRWKQPVDKPIEQVEAEFKARYDQLKKDHPKAVQAIFREGEKGFDPADPEKAYVGWMDAHINSHGPDSNVLGRAVISHGWGDLEVFMRHRSQIIRVDLSTVPTGSTILAAQLVLTRSRGLPKEGYGPEKPNMWVAEACNRPWVEPEVNAYEYAHDKYWKSVGGFMGAVSYEGDDPDFRPIYLAYGPSTGKVNVWDFTEAVRFWTDGKHPNHGFVLHGNGKDYMRAFTREFKEIQKRPMMLVIYEPRR